MDKIIKIIPRYNERKELFGYSLVTREYRNKGIYPFVHIYMLKGDNLNGYSKLLKEYLDLRK